MLVISVGLHGALLLLPTGASDDELVPAPDPEEDGIAITRIDPPSNPAAGPQATGTPTAENRNSSAKTNPSSPNSSPSSSRANASSGSARSSSGSASASANGSRGNRPAGPSRSSATPRNSRESDPTSRASGSTNSRSSNSGRTTQTTALDPTTHFLDYFAVFETYRGPVPVAAEEVEELKDLWLSGLKEAGVSLANLGSDDIQPLANLEKIPYPSAICLPQAPATAQLLVFVAADGTPHPDVLPLKDTGYTSFDDQAETVIRNHDFPKQDAPGAYLVDVVVDYDSGTCTWPPAIAGVADDFWTLLDSYIGPNLTRSNEAEAAEETWRSQLALPAATPAAGFEATVAYNLGLCLPIAPTPAQFGIVVEPDGTLRAAPKLLRSTGYEQFDRQAQGLVDVFSFSGSDAPQVHVLTVPVAYNALLCESLSPADP